MIGCWSTKGGSGTTVISAALAFSRAKTGEAVRLIDACGDLPAVLGICEPNGPGLSDWLASSRATASGLAEHAVPVTTNVSLVPRGSFENLSLDRDALARLSRALQHLGGCTIVDFGRHVERLDLRDHAIRSILVVRPCYLALRRASTSPKPDSIIIVEETSRALRPRDVEQVVGVRVMATVPIDPTIARCVDAGLLATQLPPLLATSLTGWS